MADKTPQTFQNHAKLDPPFHFFMLPVMLGTFVWASWNLVRNFGLPAAGLFVLVLGGFVATFKIRLYALKVQDRLIRLEERLRLQSILPESSRPRIAELNEDQLIGLRFASDAEVPALMEQALANKWSRKEIKQAIKDWRPDYFRV